LIVAIDGPAGSGKTSTAKAVARRLGFKYLDTGAMYRAVALAVLERGLDVTDEAVGRLLTELVIDIRYSHDELRVYRDGEDVTPAIRTPEVGGMASRVGQLPSVRAAMVDAQRRIAARFTGEGIGIVLEGRDIGTVVFPEAQVKVFMQADPEVRAQRRYEERAAQGAASTLSNVQQEIDRRDRQDTERAIAPLRRADDAIELDTTDLAFEAQVEFIADLVKDRLSQDIR
jgi:cytidylate kinase